MPQQTTEGDHTSVATDPPTAPRRGWLSARPWRRATSLRTRLLALGLAPLLLAFPIMVAVVVLGGAQIDSLLMASLRGSLTGAGSYLDQFRAAAGVRVGQLVKAQRLAELLRRPGDGRDLQQWLVTAAEGSGLDYLLVATSDGRVLASSTGVAAGTPLPPSYVIRQALLGVGNAAYERLDATQLAALSPQFPDRARVVGENQGLAVPRIEDRGLMVNAAAHVPLDVDLPDTILVGGVLLNHNLSLARTMRAVIFPVGALPDQAEGLLSLYLDGLAVASATDQVHGPDAPGSGLPAQVGQVVLAQGKAWEGRFDHDGVAFMAALDPLRDGDGLHIGMIGVFLPEAPFQRRVTLLLVSVVAVLVLAMLGLSVLVLRAGREFTQRIHAVNATMNAVRAGAGAARVGRPARDDELGRLARDFDELLDTIAAKDALQQQTNAELQRLSARLTTEHGHMAQVLAGTHAGTWAWNVQTGATEFNERWAEITGHSLAELQPISIATWARLTHPDDLALSNEALGRHFRGETAFYDMELRMRHKAGHWVWVHDRGAVSERTADGRPLWMFGTHMDITDRREATRLSSELLARLQHLSANVPGFLYQYRLGTDGVTSFPYASAGIQEVYGCTPDEVLHVSTKVTQVLHPDDQPRVHAEIQASAASLQPWHSIFRVRHPQRGERWVEGNATPEREPDGATIWHGYLRDTTDLQRQNERLKLSASVFDASQEGIMITDAERRIIDVNPAFTRITGYSRAEAVGQQPRRLQSQQQNGEFYERLTDTLRRDGRWQGELWNHRKDGSLYAELVSISAVHDDQGHISHFVSIFSDITTIKQHQAELDRLANFDPLTGIPNRRLLGDRLAQALAHARRQQVGLAVCMMDLDNFKPINDTWGHDAGDRLLIETARRLSEVVRADETVARLGGDEFVLIFRNPGSNAAFDRVMQAVSAPVDLAEATVQVSASMGVAYFHPGIDDGDQLLREADQALYRSKNLGRNRYTVYLPEPPKAQAD
ncbi:MAG: hypothetical protein RL375_1859 [Pseudomonadota bacterium]